MSRQTAAKKTSVVFNLDVSRSQACIPKLSPLYISIIVLLDFEEIMNPEFICIYLSKKFQSFYLYN